MPNYQWNTSGPDTVIFANNAFLPFEAKGVSYLLTHRPKLVLGRYMSFLDEPWGSSFMMYSTLEPSFHPLFYERKIYGLFHQRPTSNRILFWKAACQKKRDENKVKWEYQRTAQEQKWLWRICSIFILILFPIHYWQLVRWKFIDMCTNILYCISQARTKKAFFKRGRIF